MAEDASERISSLAARVAGGFSGCHADNSNVYDDAQTKQVGRGITADAVSQVIGGLHVNYTCVGSLATECN